VILPGGPPHTLAFISNDQMDRVENYDAYVVESDDLDDLLRTHPGLDELFPATLSLVASVTSSAAAQAFRGTVATLVRRRRVLVLDAHDHASAELVGQRAPWSVDPSRRPAGRGVLLSGRDTVVVQVYAGGS
jgi:S-DNA-T family DNA segregation ATPase FtsK/SpoIIIE